MQSLDGKWYPPAAEEEECNSAYGLLERGLWDGRQRNQSILQSGRCPVTSVGACAGSLTCPHTINSAWCRSSAAADAAVVVVLFLVEASTSPGANTTYSTVQRPRYKWMDRSFYIFLLLRCAYW